MFKFVVALLGLILSVNAINGKCRALVLGGGTDKGAFQAGAVQALIGLLPPGEATWDVISANGIGALNAIIIGQQAIGNEVVAGNNLRNFWAKFHKSQLYHSWFGGLLVGYYKKSGLYNNAPMRDTFSKLITGPFQRFVAVGIVDLVSTNYYSANTTLSIDLFTAALEASFNDYGLFPFTQYKEYQFVSGDLAFPVDVDTAVNDCVTLGYTRSEIIVDIVAVTGATLNEIEPAGLNTLQLFARFEEIVAYHNIEERLANAVDNHPLVTFRTEIQMKAKDQIRKVLPYDYLTLEIRKQFEAGFTAVEEQIE